MKFLFNKIITPSLLFFWIVFPNIFYPSAENILYNVKIYTSDMSHLNVEDTGVNIKVIEAGSYKSVSKYPSSKTKLTKLYRSIMVRNSPDVNDKQFIAGKKNGHTKFRMQIPASNSKMSTYFTWNRTRPTTIQLQSSVKAMIDLIL